MRRFCGVVYIKKKYKKTLRKAFVNKYMQLIRHPCDLYIDNKVLSLSNDICGRPPVAFAPLKHLGVAESRRTAVSHLEKKNNNNRQDISPNNHPHPKHKQIHHGND